MTSIATTTAVDTSKSITEKRNNRRPLVVNIKLSERYDKQTHFSFTMGLENRGYTKCLCGKLVSSTSSSVETTEILSIHQVIRKITDTDVRETCLLCSIRILQLISEMWQIEAMPTRRPKKNKE